MAWMIYGRRVVHLHARSRVQRVAAARLGLEGQAALHALLVLRALVGRAVLLRLAKHIPKVLLGGREANDQQEAHRLKCGGGWRAGALADTLFVSRFECRECCAGVLGWCTIANR